MKTRLGCKASNTSIDNSLELAFGVGVARVVFCFFIVCFLSFFFVAFTIVIYSANERWFKGCSLGCYLGGHLGRHLGGHSGGHLGGHFGHLAGWSQF